MFLYVVKVSSYLMIFIEFLEKGFSRKISFRIIWIFIIVLQKSLNNWKIYPSNEISPEFFN